MNSGGRNGRSRYETPDYLKARALAEALDDKSLDATLRILRAMLAAYGDEQFRRRRKADPRKLASLYQRLAERKA